MLKPGGTLLLSTDNARNRITQTLNFPRTAVVRALRLTGRRRQVEFPHAAFRLERLLGLFAETPLEVERVETFRFHLDPPLDRPPTRRFLNRLDRVATGAWLGRPDRGRRAKALDARPQRGEPLEEGVARAPS